MSFTNYLHKLVFPLIILLLAYLPLAGQTPYVFRHLKVENGLSNNNVKTILKDCEGFLWIGTANGLNRYDGYSFTQPAKPIPIAATAARAATMRLLCDTISLLLPSEIITSA